jgi:hypothetical protein
MEAQIRPVLPFGLHSAKPPSTAGFKAGVAVDGRGNRIASLAWDILKRDEIRLNRHRALAF